MKNRFVKKFAQITLALVLTVGCSLGVQAASLDEVVFGQSTGDIISRSQTATFVNFVEMLPERTIVADPQVEPFMGSEIDLAKYAFSYDLLCNVEVNFKTSTLDEYNKLREKMIAQYGPGEESTNFYKSNGLKVTKCVWKSDVKAMELTYLHNDIHAYDNLYLNVFCVKAGDKI